MTEKREQQALTKNIMQLAKADQNNVEIKLTEKLPYNLLVTDDKEAIWKGNDPTNENTQIFWTDDPTQITILKTSFDSLWQKITSIRTLKTSTPWCLLQHRSTRKDSVPSLDEWHIGKGRAHDEILLANWKNLLFVGIIAVCLSFLGLIKYELANSRAELAEYKSAYAILANSVKTQNTEIEKWKTESEIRTTNAKAAMKEANVYLGIAKEKSKRLETLKQTGDECEDIKYLIDSYRAS